MFVMLPVMLAARKLDGEDPNIIFLLRCAYGAVQAVSVLLSLFVYMKSSAAAADKDNARMIYVPPAPQPFADPDAKGAYSEKKLSDHITSQSLALLKSTAGGIVMTVGLHMWKGMVMGLAIQSVMAPFNLMENPLVKAILLGGGLSDLSTKKIFGEKSRDEMTSDDEITDAEGNVVLLNKNKAIATSQKSKAEPKSFEDVLLDTWDLGAEADIAPLMEVLSKKNINFQTKENGWTPIMIMSGLGAKKVVGAMRQMKALGADPSLVDKEGWNALHWAAFHGSAAAAKVLLDTDDFDVLAKGLHNVADKEGKTAITLAQDEGNDDVAKAIEEAECSEEQATDAQDEKADEGLRKRK